MLCLPDPDFALSSARRAGLCQAGTDQGLHHILRCVRGTGAPSFRGREGTYSAFGAFGEPSREVRQGKETFSGHAAAAPEQNIMAGFELFFQCVQVSEAW